MVERTQTPFIAEDLRSKMVLLVGPRQCGKTTVAKRLVADAGGAYYNWDVDDHRRLLRQGKLDLKAPLWVFDELHKYRHWRNWLKGQFDLHRARQRILVTGSARLDVYHRGGDSLQGRFFLHRLHPLTYAEVTADKTPITHLDQLTCRISDSGNAIDTAATAQLLRFGGFPEPFMSGSDRHAQRWRNSYGTTLVREDIRTLETLRDLDKVELLFERLSACVGSVLSINALRKDLEVAFETVRHWLSVLEHTYAVFRIPPFGPPRIKAVKKEQKLYMWDWSRVPEPGPRLENMVAVHLLRFCHFAQDVLGESVELRYFRDVVGHEVDFVLLRKGKPWLAIEVKKGDRSLDGGLRYLLARVRFSLACQVSTAVADDRLLEPIGGCAVRIMPVERLLGALG